MTINDLAGGSVVSVDPGTSLRQTAELMHETAVGSVAVAVDGALEGILTERDILKAVADYADLDRDVASAWMTAMPDTFGPDMSVDDAANWMLATGYRHLPIVDEAGSVVAMVSIKDVLWAVTNPTAG